MKLIKFYRVSTEGDCEGRSRRTLGYASGEVEDIKAYYDNQKYYNLTVEEIDIKHITPESLGERRDLIEEKEILSKRLDEINKKLE